MSRLSKSRFCYGLQCVKQLWWRVHEPDALELKPSPALQAVFTRGSQVGERARDEFPGGTLVDREHYQVTEKIADTQNALAAGPNAIFEASFQADGVFVAVDALEKVPGDHVVVEVKSTLEVKDQYIPDVAIQLHVLRASGLSVGRAEIMHLNRACRYPDLSNLFVREDVTEQAEAFLPGIPARLDQMRRALDGPLPVIPTGSHCSDPYDCPFMARCWPALPDDHVSTLYRGGRKAEALLAQGVESIRDIPDGFKLSEVAARQVRAVKSGSLVIDAGLGEALRQIQAPVAYLDFETINPAIPAWEGCGPFMLVPVQMSCHVIGESGSVEHFEHLAEGRGDPGPGVAEAVVRACEGAKTVVAYNASFERRCIELLADRVPALREELLAITSKLVDLLPIARDHVYHPAFHGSFSMKAVGPALVEGLSYEGMEIGEGGTASAVLEAMLLGQGQEVSSTEDQSNLRRQLLAYCRQDTQAMVAVVSVLQRVASARIATSRAAKGTTS